MTTKLTKPIRREIVLDGETYTVSLSPDAVRITRKGFRKGRALPWRRLLVEGDEADAGDDRRFDGVETPSSGDRPGAGAGVIGAVDRALRDDVSGAGSSSTDRDAQR